MRQRCFGGRFRGGLEVVGNGRGDRKMRELVKIRRTKRGRDIDV